MYVRLRTLCLYNVCQIITLSWDIWVVTSLSCNTFVTTESISLQVGNRKGNKIKRRIGVLICDTLIKTNPKIIFPQIPQIVYK